MNMSSVRSAKHLNGPEPSPSSIIARNVGNTNGLLDLDQARFHQLLDESLASDEDGNPNLGSDFEVNHQLICIILKAGIDPQGDNSNENPFNSRNPHGKDDRQLITCFDVIRLAIERTRQVLYIKSFLDDAWPLENPLPLFVWLIPRVLPFLGPHFSKEVQDAASRIVAIVVHDPAALLVTDKNNICLKFIQCCISTLLDFAIMTKKLFLNETVVIDEETLSKHVWRIKLNLEGFATQLRFTSVGDMLSSVIRTMSVLSKLNINYAGSLTYLKQLNRLQKIIDALVTDEVNESKVESLVNDVQQLKLSSQTGQLLQETHLASTTWSDNNRARKRQRLSSIDLGPSDPSDVNAYVIRKLTGALCGHAVADLEGLSKTAVPHFRRLPEEQQCASIELIGSSICQIASQSLHQKDYCVCENSCKIDSALEVTPAPEFLETLMAIVTPQTRSAKARAVGMLSLRRIMLHNAVLADARLAQTSAGEWCLQSLRSSSRDLRLAAVGTLQAYVMERAADMSLTRDNRIIALDFLSSLWQRNEPVSQETAILALVKMAAVVGDEELNIILLRLVEYLGHTNPYLSGLVYAELQQLSQTLQVTAAVLFRPFWRTIGVVVARTMTTRPVVAQQLCNLLGMQISGLMLLIEEHALPYMILNQNHNLISQFAAAHGPTVSVFDLCTQRKTLPTIFSFMLLQLFQDADKKIMELLVAVADDFGGEDLAGWLAYEPTQIACELLKAIGDSTEGKAHRPSQALQTLAQVLHRKPGQHGSHARRSEIMGNFLETNALAIVTHYTKLLNDLETKEPKLEKRRCVVALGEIVKIGKSRIVVALPQICACLRSALDDEDLCDAAFLSWIAILRSLKEDEFSSLIDQTFAIIVKGWNSFNTATQKQAMQVLEELLTKHVSLMREMYYTLPSLSSIPAMAKIENEVNNLKRQMDERHRLVSFTSRLADENIIVIEQALEELMPLLRTKQDVLHRVILQEQPDDLVAELTRSLLDCAVKFQGYNNVVRLCGQCLGSIGCLDPNKIENAVEKRTIVVVSNFGKAEETVDFIIFFLETVLVKAFLSSSTTRGQGFLGWAMQEFLKLSGTEDAPGPRNRLPIHTSARRWNDLPDGVKNTLTPFLTSKYSVQEARPRDECQYPLLTPGVRHKDWLRTIVLDFLHRGSGDNVQIIFNICRRIIHAQDTIIPAFLLPYTALNLVISGIEEDTRDISREILHILRLTLSDHERNVQDDIKLCSQSIFEILDYMSRWLQQKRKIVSVALARSERGATDSLLEIALSQIKNVEQLLESIPPELLSQRAIDCKSYARALFHWEQFMRKTSSNDHDARLAHLQDIYAQIEEPDGIEGISSQMHLVNVEQRVLEHRKAGRWTVAESWYQMHTTAEPENLGHQLGLLECLKQSGQYSLLLDHFEGLSKRDESDLKYLKSYAVEAAWATNQYDRVSRLLPGGLGDDFAGQIATILMTLRHEIPNSKQLLDELFRHTTAEFTPNSIISFQSCHETSLRLQALDDIRLIVESNEDSKTANLQMLHKKLNVLGSNAKDKQFLLTLRRAAMVIKSDVFLDEDLASSWLTSAQIARKSQQSSQAFDAVMRASTLGDKSAIIEEAKLMWQEGHHRKAIQALEGTIDSGALVAHNYVAEDGPNTMTAEQKNYQNEITAKAYLLLGKWLDQSGQTQSEIIIKTLRKSTEQYRRGEKGWYYLGRHYNKVLDSEKVMAPGKESQTYLTGEMAKLVIENYLRSLLTGSKYVFQTLPKILTLWFELIAGSEQPLDARRGNAQFQAHSAAQRAKVIEETNAYIKKYIDRIQAVIFYTILPQVLARVTHANTAVYNILTLMVIKVVRAFPQQALWALLPVAKSQSKDRAMRGLTLIQKVVEANKKATAKEISQSDLKNLITASQKFADEVLRIADFPIEQKVTKVSLARELGFNHKIAPSRLVVPVESCLIPSIPTSHEPQYLKTFRPFSREPVTISAFLDEAMVLASLQKPRKLTIRGSDGSIYGILAKPKDDLRKDQRLMEFNTMINRFLKRDIEASKRRLYIRTYAVIPLNEECGLIEWVNNLKTLRDILLKIYKDRNVVPNYTEIRSMLDEASSGPPEKVQIFGNKVLKAFPPVFHEWFVDSFPDPSAWFNARLRYTRSCAVMSICGHVLGLGDRHGENILFEEDNGSLMHVDFNCLFDKGLTFEKPEMVPFRLTHNMVDAMGAYRYEGPFRKCCEITLTLLRGNEDALMTILETFLHDPTTDFIEKGRRKKHIPGVPDTPMEVLDSVRSKVRGMLVGESVPLGVGGYVEEMIKRATDPRNLSKMYIGWCAFF